MAENVEWELSKENILPLKQGRKIASLRSALSGYNEEKQLQRRAFEKALRTNSGEELLEVWYSYILWIEQNYPKGGKEGNLCTLIENCVIQFKDQKKFYNDERYVKIWIKYANSNLEALEIYNYMYTHMIGCQMASFYENWAWQLQNIENYKQADEVLCKGIQCRAQPIEILLTAQRELHLKLKNKIEDDMENFPAEDPRTALGLLNTNNNAAPINRTGLAKSDVQAGLPSMRKPQNKITNNNKKTFRIFAENSSATMHLPLQTTEPVAVVSRSERGKENEIKPKKWPESKIKPKYVPVQQSKPTFEVHVDEDAVQTSLRAPIPSRVLRNKDNWDKWKPQIAVFEPFDPKQRPRYMKHLVYAGGIEFSPEEIEAERRMKLLREEEKLKNQQALEEEIRNLKMQLLNIHACVPNANHYNEAGKMNSGEYQQFVGTSSQSSSLVVKETVQPSHKIDRHDLSNTVEKKNVEQSNEMETQNNRAESFASAKTENVEQFNDKSLIHFPAASHSFPEINAEKSYHERSQQKSPHTKEVSNIMIGIWGNSLFQSQFEASNNSEDLAKQNEDKPIIVYHDWTENLNQLPPISDVIMSKEVLESEMKENISPEDYIQVHTERQLAGILQDAKDIETEEPQNSFVEMESDEDDDIDIPRNFDEMTIPQPPPNPEHFAAHAGMVSTPFCGSSIKLSHSDVKMSSPPPQQPTVISNPAPAIQEQTVNMQQGRNNKTYVNIKTAEELSMIAEVSCENYKSSASSSSGSGTEASSQTCNPSLSRNLTKIPTIPENSVIHSESRRESEESEESMDVDQPVIPVDINPFDSKVTGDLLSKLNSPLSAIPTYTRVNSKVPLINIGKIYPYGSDKFAITESLAEGAYAKIYVAKKFKQDNSFDFKFALKVCKNANEWEFYICNEVQERLLNCGAPNAADNVIKIVKGIIFDDGMFLASELGIHGTLLDVNNLYKGKKQTMPECLVLYLTLEMLIIIQRVHYCKIIHADVKPDNFLVNNLNQLCTIDTSSMERLPILKLIDFGRSIDLKLYPPGTAFMEVVTTSAFKCTEMMDGKPWTYQTDWFGVLGSIHVLLFSEYMKVHKNKKGEWEIKNKFKRYWHTDFWQDLFHTLLNIPSCTHFKDKHIFNFIDQLLEIIQQPSQLKAIQTKGRELCDMVRSGKRNF